MIYHVLPGDSLVETFEKTNLEGEIIVCRECLVEGNLKAENLEDFWQIREDYLSKSFPDAEISYTVNVRSEFEKLLNVKPNDEVNLWFEYELFCQVNLWFCLWLIEDKNANIYRVAPTVLSENDLWKGFGRLEADELEKCFADRIKLSKDDVLFGTQLWKDFCFRNYESLKQKSFEKRKSFPHLEKVGDAAFEIETRPAARVKEIIKSGENDFGKIFQQFSETEGVYGFGDSQVRKIFDSINK